MPLIDLKTNLKDLKFGHDRRDGDSSKQPFVPTLIPANDDPLETGLFLNSSLNVSISNPDQLGSLIGISSGTQNEDPNISIQSDTTLKYPSSGTGGVDFLIRGGTLLPNVVYNDAERLTKFFKSTNGILFTIKQNLLSRISVRPENAGKGLGSLLNDKIYTPFSTILGAVGSPFGLHTNKQGLNPLLGIFKDYTPDRYYTYIINDNKEIQDADKTNKIGNKVLSRNRLYSLYSVKLINNPDNRFTRRNDVSGNPDFLISYGGGPGSILGIGRTRIKYATDQFDSKLTVISDNVNGWTLKQISNLSDSTHLVNSKHTATAIISDYKPKEIRIISGDPGNPNQKYANTANFTNGYLGADEATGSFGAASPFSYDRITALPIYRTDEDSTDYDLYSDLVDFRIGVIDNDSNNIDNIHFRAFLNTINDNYESNWNTIKYIGRGENFYTYNGFDRKISFSWTVAAQSKIELIPMYKKLNYLASLTAPDYGQYGYMRANIIQLTIGGYIFNQPGIINKVSYEISEESTWEIGIADNFSTNVKDKSVKQLPHMIKVQFDFTPIHNFVPRKQQNIYGDDSTKGLGQVTNYGREQFISLADSDSNNYNELYEQDNILYNKNAPIPSTPSSNVSQEEDNNENSKIKKNSKLKKWWQDFKAANRQSTYDQTQFNIRNGFMAGTPDMIGPPNFEYATPGEILGKAVTEIDDPYQELFDDVK